MLGTLLAEPLHARSPAAFALADTILRSGQFRTMVMEKEYVDSDYRRAYQRFYARAFPNYSRHATRLHFFSANITPRSLANLERRKISESYLGYCVVRPLRTRRVGRTVLHPGVAEPQADLPLALSEFDVNLAGSRLKVTGAPFLEQDTRVGCCASCAIWMSTMMAGPRFGLPTATVADITELATEYAPGERVLGSTGLSWGEMETALRKMGYNPLTLGVSNRESALRAIHPYLEGGIAPILLITLEDGGLHAAVAVGHAYDPAQQVGEMAEVRWEGRSIRFRRSSEWINYLLIHDDQRGPFRAMRLVDSVSSSGQSECHVEIDTSWPTFDGNAGWPTCTKGTLYAVLTPAPAGISMTGIEAEEKAARLTEIAFDVLFRRGMPNNIVLRTYLARSNDYKVFAHNRGLAGRIRHLLRGKPLPHWIWITELCTTGDATVANGGTRMIRGEVVLDGNGSPWTPDFLALHVIAGDVGYLALMTPNDPNAADAIAKGLLYRGAAPYKAFIR